MADVGVLVMMEAALVIALDGGVLYRHAPVDRTAASLPDSRALWDAIWENRENVQGVAHSHPGGGVPSPSYTDLTTFAAVEAALGRRLDWWIASSEALVVCRAGSVTLYQVSTVPSEQAWVEELRALSRIDPRPDRPSAV